MCFFVFFLGFLSKSKPGFLFQRAGRVVFLGPPKVFVCRGKPGVFGRF